MIEIDIDKILELSNHIMNMARNSLVVNLRFMDRAISRLERIPVEDSDIIAVNGQYIFFNPVKILKSYKKCKELPAREYLHMIMHCVFHHAFVSDVDRVYWDLACDIAVENAIIGLNLQAVKTPSDMQQVIDIQKIKKKVKYLNAECIYRYLKDNKPSDKELKRLNDVFSHDDHTVWYMRSLYEEQIQKYQNSNGNGGKKTESDVKKISSDAQRMSSDDKINVGTGTLLNRASLTDDWKDISRQMQMNLKSFSKNQGSEAGDMMQSLNAINREKYDYSAFLRKFAVMGEAMRINDDEFDYIFYSYGMQMYERMPLIEPLEYKDVKKIKEFVIAIDTSGSTSGELVQKFMQKTYNILKQQESFFSKINLHIVQCDAEIQEVVKITKQEEFDEYIKHMKIRGLGGTDFRPVFAYVDKLIDNREFTNLKGMIYFTDGYGDFPNRQPDYDVAVIYIDDGYNNPDVPVWAMKLILSEEEIIK